jgi:hypothetical protein
VDALHVPLAAAALLLVPAGVTKVTRPIAAHRALLATGLASRVPLVRALGVVELLVAFGALLSGARVFPAALALVYGGFTAFVLLALWRHAPIASCGCFGSTDTPPTFVHVGVDAALATASALAAGRGLRAPIDVLRDGGGDAAVLVLGALAGAAALYAALTLGGSRAARSHPLRR